MILLAFDRSTVRRFDVDGRLHVARTNISKANICPYRGNEIPGWQALGLDGNRVYKLLRHPDELAKAAPTFNNLPVLNVHVPTTAWDHKPEHIVGSTGTDSRFDGTYLQNSAVIWAQDSIDLIETNEQKEWSCGYRFKPDMTNGIFYGLHYDGIMRNIVGNHVALVTVGRAGPDVVVGDADMKSRKALMLSGAVAALVRPHLAADAKIDFTGAFDGVTAATLAASKDSLAATLLGLTTGKLVADAGLSVSDFAEAIDAIDGMVLDAAFNDDLTVAAPAAPAPGPKGPKGDKGDPAPALAIDADAIRAGALADFNALRLAEREVEPFVGALDNLPATAAEIYKLALDAAKIDLTDVDPSAYKAMVRVMPKPADPQPTIALDRAARADGATDFHARYPHAVKLG